MCRNSGAMYIGWASFRHEDIFSEYFPTRIECLLSVWSLWSPVRVWWSDKRTMGRSWGIVCPRLRSLFYWAHEERPLGWSGGTGIRLESSRPTFHSRSRRKSLSRSSQNWYPGHYPVRCLRRVGPVSVYCEWVRQEVWSATSISVWKHVQLP